MEESENGLDEWVDLVMTSDGLLPGFESESYVVELVSDQFSGNVGVVGDNQEKKIENFEVDLDKKLEGCELGSSCLIAGIDSHCFRTGGSVAERRAAKLGFNVDKICTPRVRSSSPLASPTAQSPCYLTIPAGLSPAALLDSPILLPNSQLSPTTGTFSSPALDGDGQILVSISSAETGNAFDSGSGSTFKPNIDTGPPSCFQAVDKQGLVAHFDSQSLKSLHPPVDFDFPVQLPEEVAVNHHDAGSPPIIAEVPDTLAMNGSSTIMRSSLANNVVGVQMDDKNDPSQEEDSGTHNSFDEDHKGKYSTAGNVRTAEDGYNWRKYGQKQVKGSEYPRSYYKCTHSNCQVKKKVERSHDGQITEIIYKGAHNHPKPQPCQKSAIGSSLPFNEASDAGEVIGSCVKAEGGSIWRNIQPGFRDVKFGSDWRTDGLEITPSTSVVTEASDPLSTTQGKTMGMLESVGTPEFSSTRISYEDDEEDAATEGSFSLGDDNDCEPDSKRRKKESYYFEPTMGSRAVREPRVVVQIESEIDVLDDGYRWRKYGQKVVKGNPNPRSYYKCTSAGCTVKKHVERASHNLKFVITTYEGKHNHEVPTARNSSHANSGSGTLPPASNNQSTLPLPRNPHLSKPELFRQDLPPHFDTKMEGNTDFLRPNFLGNLEGGISSFYPMKFPTLPTARPYVPFGLSNHHVAYPGGTGMLPTIPDIPIPFPLGFPHSTNLAIPNCSHSGRSLSSIQPLFLGPQYEESKVKLLRPKQEQRDESFHDTHIEHTNTSSSHTYNRVLPTFPS